MYCNYSAEVRVWDERGAHLCGEDDFRADVLDGQAVIVYSLRGLSQCLLILLNANENVSCEGVGILKHSFKHSLRCVQLGLISFLPCNSECLPATTLELCQSQKGLGANLS